MTLFPINPLILYTPLMVYSSRIQPSYNKSALFFISGGLFGKRSDGEYILRHFVISSLFPVLFRLHIVALFLSDCIKLVNFLSLFNLMHALYMYTAQKNRIFLFSHLLSHASLSLIIIHRYLHQFGDSLIGFTF